MTTSSTAASTAAQPAFFTDPSTSKAWWFLDSTVVLRNPEGSPAFPLVMELLVPPGGSPPRHVHEDLNDAFFVLEGEVVLSVGDRTTVAAPGTYAVVPAGSDHTFRVTSQTPARLLLIHDDDSFLRMVQAGGTPADEPRLPPRGEFDLDLETMSRLVDEHDSRVVGPSLEEDEARASVTAREATLGPVDHVAIGVTDLRRSEPWYVETFELTRVDGEIGADGSGHVVLASRSGGWKLTLAAPAASGFQHVAFTCHDRDALAASREALAGRAVTPGTITDEPYGSGFVVRDPDGLELELFSPPTGSH
jgi:quercetin dioxygenase-like cupin family protein/catechol 2,3-dioxygenase-like lactoylglutathione lyase family enzyme